MVTGALTGRFSPSAIGLAIALFAVCLLGPGPVAVWTAMRGHRQWLLHARECRARRS